MTYGLYNFNYYGVRPVVSIPISGNEDLKVLKEIKEIKEFTAFQNNIVDFIKPKYKYEYSTTDVDHNERTLTVNFSIEDKYFLESTLAESNIKVRIDDGTGNFVENATLSHADNITLTKVEDITSTVNGASQKTGENYELVISGFEVIDYSGTVQIVIDADVAVDSSGNFTDAQTLTVGINEPSKEGDAEIVDVIDPVWEMTDYTINRKRDGAEADTVDIVFTGTDKYFKQSTLTKENIKIYIFDDSNAMVQNTTITKELSESEPVDTANGENPGVQYTLTLGNFKDYSGYIAVSIDANTLLDEYTNKNKETYIVGDPAISDWRIFYKGDENVFLIAADYVENTLLPTDLGFSLSTEDDCGVYWASEDDLNVTTIDSAVASKYLIASEIENIKDTIKYKATASLVATDKWKNFVNSTYADSAIGTPTIEMYVNSWNALYPEDELTVSWGLNITAEGYALFDGSSLTGGGVSVDGLRGFENSLFNINPGYDHNTLDDMPPNRLIFASPLQESHPPTNNTLIYNHTLSLWSYTIPQTDYFRLRPVVCLNSDVKATKNAVGTWQLSTTSGNTLFSQVTSANYGDYVDYPVSISGGEVNGNSILVDFIHPVWKKEESVINRLRSGDADNSVEVTLKGTDKFLESTAITNNPDSNISDYIDVYVMNSDGEYVKNDTITTSLLSIGEVKDGAIEAKIKLSNFGNNFSGKVAIKVLANAITDSSGNGNLESPDFIGVGNVDWVEKAATTITNANIGEYIDLGNDIVDFNGTTGVTTDDWRVLYVDGNTVYAILSDYLPADQVPEASGLNTDPTTYPYSVWSITSRDTLINGLLHTETAWRGLTNGINGAEAIGSPTAELLMNSYNTKNGTELVYTEYPTLSGDLYVPNSGTYSYCSGYWLASPAANGFAWSIGYDGIIDDLAFYSVPIDGFPYTAARPVVALPIDTPIEKENGVWTVQRTTSTLESVTNDNIGEYIDLGNDIVDGLDGTWGEKGLTTDDWRILYAEDTDSDGTTDIVHAILADYFPVTTKKADGTTYVAGAGLDTYSTYPYSVRSTKNRDTLLTGLTTSSYWNELANGISGATATGSPTAELLMNSYNTKNGTNLVYTSYPTLSSSTEDYDLYVPHTSSYQNCYRYWLASPYAGDSYDVWCVGYDGYVSNPNYNYANSVIRPVVSLPSNIQGAVVDGVWTIGAKGSGTQAGVGDPAGAEDMSKYTAFHEDIVDYANPEIKYTYKEEDIDYDLKTLTVNFNIEDQYFLESTLTAENIKVLIDDGTGKYVESEILSNTVAPSASETANLTLEKVSDVKTKVDGVADSKTGESYKLVIKGFEEADYSGTIQVVIDADVAADTSGNKNVQKTLTIGTDDTPAVVDLVDPVWKITNIKVDTENKKVIFDLEGTDTNYASNSLDEEDITVFVNGAQADSIKKTIIAEEDILKDGTETVIGIRKTIELTEFEQAELQEGKDFKEWSGNITLNIVTNTIFDIFDNTNKLTDLDAGYADLVEPEIIKVSSILDDETNPTKMTYVFKAIDRYFADSSIELGKLTDDTKIKVWIDGEVASSVTKTITDIQDINVTIDGASVKIGETYTLELTEFPETLRQTKSGTEDGYKPYLEWSGDVKIDVMEGVVKDAEYTHLNTAGEETTSNTVNDTTTLEGEFIDNIKPEYTYKYSKTVVNNDDAVDTLTVVFDITDKYFKDGSSKFAVGNVDDTLLKILVNGVEANLTKEITKVEPINDTVNGEEVKVGERYTLVISDWEKETGEPYKDFSGVVDLVFAESMAEDTSGNATIGKTITIGMDDPVPPGSSDNNTPAIIDVVDPVWEKIEATSDITNGTGTVTVQGTDRYYSSDSLDVEDIKVYVDGELRDDLEVTIGEKKPLEEIPGFTTLASVTNNNIGEYIDLGNDIVDFNGTTDVTTDDWRIFYVDEENGTVYAILADYLPADQVPEAAGLETDGTYGVLSNTDENTLINGLKGIDSSGNATGAWNELANGISGATATGSPTADLIIKSYNIENDPDIELERGTWLSDTENHSLYLPHNGGEKGCHGYKLASAYIIGEVRGIWCVWSILASPSIDPTDYNDGYTGIRPVVALPASTSVTKDGDVWTVPTSGNASSGTTTIPLSSVTNANIGDYVDLGNDIVDFGGTTGVTTDDWRILNVDGEGVTLILSDYLPNSKVPNIGTFGKASGTYSIYFEDQFQMGVLFENGIDWVEFHGIAEEPAFKDYPNIFDLYNSYNAKNKTNLTIRDKLDNSISGNDLYMPRQSVVENTTYGYFVSYHGSSPYQSENDSVYGLSYDGTFEVEGYPLNTDRFALRPTITISFERDGGGVSDNVNLRVIPAEGNDSSDSSTGSGTNTEPTTEKHQYGIETTITVSGFETDVSQVYIQIDPGTLTDEYGNTSEISDKFMLFNCLKPTSEEKTEDSPFLGSTEITRKEIKNLVFEKSLDGMEEAAIKWDVSDMQDGSIMAWVTEDASGNKTVHIGSKDEIYSNVDASYLFAQLVAINSIENRDWLYTNHAKDMNHMFYYLGTNVTSGIVNLDLGDHFDTRNVTNMEGMFEFCGHNNLETLNLGPNFHTDNVTNMAYMFASCGAMKLKELNLTDNFNTENVTDMNHMFEACGTKQMTTLNLGANFNTENVTDMNHMFSACGMENLTALDLGEHFNTSLVTDMSYMFEECGQQKMTTFDLGENFYTSNVTNMERMFADFAKYLPSLSLTEKFDTVKVENMKEMFKGCGDQQMKSLDLGPAFVKIPENNEGFVEGFGFNDINTTIIYCAESIYKDIHHFKLNKDVTEAAIEYYRGTINPRYALLWRKVSNTVSEDAMDIIIEGTDDYNGYVSNSLTDASITVLVDGETVDSITKTEFDALTAEEQAEALKTKVVVELSAGTDLYTEASADGTIPARLRGVQYTVHLSNFNQPGRKFIPQTQEEIDAGATPVYKSYDEWSGNVTLKIAPRTLIDKFGTGNLENDIEDVEAVNAEAEDKMFIDDIKPEISYRYSAESDINQTAKTLTVTFDITDKYINLEKLPDTDEFRNTLKQNIKVVVDGDEDADAVVTKEITEQELKATIDGTEKVVGKRYTLVIGKLEQVNKPEGADYNLYSGPINIVFAANIAEDMTGNKNIEKTITIGRDDPIPPGDSDSEGVIVDVVDPLIETSNLQVNQEEQKVTVDLKITDKYFDPTNDLLMDKIKIFFEDEEVSGFDTNLVFKEDVYDENNNKIGIVKTLELSNFVEDSRQLVSRTEEVDGEEVVVEEYKPYLEWSGNIILEIEPGIIRDLNGNTNKISRLPLGLIDFINPEFTYKSSDTVVEYDQNTVTVEFDVVDKYFKQCSLSSDPTASNITVKIDQNDIANTLVTKELSEVGAVTGVVNGETKVIGKRYKLIIGIENLPQEGIAEGDKYVNYSGPINLVFAQGIAEDHAGNKNVETTITLGQDEPIPPGESTEEIIIDNVKPTWHVEESRIIRKRNGAEIDCVEVDLIGSDKYYASNSLTADKITVWVNDVEKDITVDLGEPQELTETRNGETAKYGVKYTVKLSGFGVKPEEYGKVKLRVADKTLKDETENENEALDIEIGNPLWVEQGDNAENPRYKAFRDGEVDFMKPKIQYLSCNSTGLDTSGRIVFDIQVRDKSLIDTNYSFVSNTLQASDITVLCEGVNVTSEVTIEVALQEGETVDNNPAVNPSGYDLMKYQITLSNLGSRVGTYTLVFRKGVLEDTSGNTNNATTLSFSKLVTGSQNYTMVNYHTGTEGIAFVNEPWTTDTTYRASSVAELLHNDVFNEEFKYANGTQTAKGFKGWAVADEEGNITSPETIYGLYDEIPKDVTNLKAVWEDAKVIFVSKNGNNTNDGLSPSTPVQTLDTAYSKLNASGTKTNQIIVIMNDVTWNGTAELDKNATITSLYAGVDYRTSGAVLKVGANMNVDGDLILDNIVIQSTSNTVPDTTEYIHTQDYTNLLIMNYHELAIGRGVTTPTGSYTFGAIIGGNYRAQTTTGEIGNHNMYIESGKYNNIIVGSAITSPTIIEKYVSHNVEIGSIKDRPKQNNARLEITGYFALGQNEKAVLSQEENAYQNTYANVNFYAGTFSAQNPFNKNQEYAAIYLGSMGTGTEGKTIFNMYQGIVNGNIYGGARTTDTENAETVTTTMNFYGGTVKPTGSETLRIMGAGATADSVGSIEMYISSSASITADIYGGAYTKNVTGNTEIEIDRAEITGNVFGAGYNGGTHNGNIKLDLLCPEITKEVYGGGNKANVGTSGSPKQITINLPAGTIQSNLNGGSKEGVVYGDIDINIGKATCSDLDYPQAVIIGSSIYGSGSSEYAGTTSFNYDTISVYGDITIDIDPIENGSFSMENNIYGAGQSATYNGEANINISNLGTAEEHYVLTSIQRATNVVIKNSELEMTGVKDNKNSSELLETDGIGYTFNRIDSLTIANNTSLYLDKTMNIVQEFNSMKIDNAGNATKQSVTIENGVASTNGVTNRMFVREGINLWFANRATPWKYSGVTWGDVNGMTYFGQYAYDRTASGELYFDIYDPNYEDGTGIANFFTELSEIVGKHKASHDIEVDGFYTNIGDYTDPTNVTVTKAIMDVQEYDSAKAYKWIQVEPPEEDVPEEVGDYTATLVAKTYQPAPKTISTINLSLAESQYEPGTTFEITNVNVNTLLPGVTLVDPATIPIIGDEATVDDTFGVEMIAESGWVTGEKCYVRVAGNSQTGSISGNTRFVMDDSGSIPTLKFRIYNSYNIQTERSLGAIMLIVNVIGPDGTTIGNKTIVVNMRTEIDFNGAKYESTFMDSEQATMKFTSDSRVDLAYMLYYSELAGNVYDSSDYRVLNSNYQLPIGTKITMVDLAQSKAYYYQVNELKEAVSGRYIYNLSDFIEMGCVDNASKQVYANSDTAYYNSEKQLAAERYEISIDFSEAEVAAHAGIQIGMELRNAAGATKFPANSVASFDLVTGKNANMTETVTVRNAIDSDDVGTPDSDKGYLFVEELNLVFDVDGSIAEQVVDSQTVKDTKYHEQKTGFVIEMINKTTQERIDFVDEDYIQIGGVKTYASNGVIRYHLSNHSLLTISRRLLLHVNRTTAETGEYAIRVHFISSDNGLHYQGQQNKYQDIPIYVISTNVGFNLDISNENRVIHKDASEDGPVPNKVMFELDVQDTIPNMYMTITMYRRNPTYNSSGTYNDVNYSIVDFNEVFKDELFTTEEAGKIVTSNTLEYVIEQEVTPGTTMGVVAELVSGLKTGEYKAEFKLYTERSLLQTVSKTFIVVP